jgi:hypothetical protein
MARTRAATAPTRSPTKKLGGQNPPPDDEELEHPVRPKRDAAAATHLKKAAAAKNAKKAAGVNKKAKTKAKKAIPPPLNSGEDEGMVDADADPPTDTNPAIDLAPGDESLSFDFKHLAHYLAKAKKDSFAGRTTKEQAKITGKIGRDLQRINFWVGEQAPKSPLSWKRNVRISDDAASGAKKAGKGKGRAKEETDKEMEEDEGDAMGDDKDDISDGKFIPRFPFIPFASVTAYPYIFIHRYTLHPIYSPPIYSIISELFANFAHIIGFLPIISHYSAESRPTSPFRFWPYSESRADIHIV